MFKLNILIAVLALLAPSLSSAKANNDAFAWYGFFNKTQLSDSVSWWTETQLRYNLNEGEMGQTLVRTGALFPVKNSQTRSEFGLLYAFIHTGLSKEHRIAAQHPMSY